MLNSTTPCALSAALLTLRTKVYFINIRAMFENYLSFVKKSVAPIFLFNRKRQYNKIAVLSFSFGGFIKRHLPVFYSFSIVPRTFRRICRQGKEAL
ncbi:MAG: hypothetical protein IJX08_09455, partial [Clostridia bacterium]|nr:hypothetical protein [Clostridia bacterium]